MAKGKKLILKAGESGMFSCIGYSSGFEKNGFYFDEDGCTDVALAIDKINSKKYWGLVMSSLVMENAVDTVKHHNELKRFGEFDNPPYIWRSGGLYVVEQACKKGLVVIVNSIAEEPMHLKKAERLGAKCFDGFYSDLEEENLKYFLSHL